MTSVEKSGGSMHLHAPSPPSQKAAICSGQMGQLHNCSNGFSQQPVVNKGTNESSTDLHITSLKQILLTMLFFFTMAPSI